MSLIIIGILLTACFILLGFIITMYVSSKHPEINSPFDYHLAGLIFMLPTIIYLLGIIMWMSEFSLIEYLGVK